MQLKDLTWEQQIKHVPLEGTTREMLLSVIGGLVKRIEAMESSKTVKLSSEVTTGHSTWESPWPPAKKKGDK